MQTHDQRSPRFDEAIVSLSPEESAAFDERGFAGPFTLYAPDEMRSKWRDLRRLLLDRSIAVYQDGAAISGATNIANYDRHLDVDWLADHVCRGEIVGRVRSVLGPDVLCWRTEFFPKYPNDEGTDWHQADTFANASGRPQIVWPQNREFGGTITVWTAFTDATVSNGCLQLIPGTHTSMNYDESKRMTYDPSRINAELKQGVRRGFFGYDYRQLQKDEDWRPDESRAVSIEMQAGQFVMFWSTLMHASHPHLGLSAEMRMGFASRYVPSTVMIYPDTQFIEEYGGKVSLERYGAVCVSGSSVDNGNRIATHTTRGHPFAKCL